jgi:prepilin-type processing-associated H-X9-DG protein
LTSYHIDSVERKQRSALAVDGNVSGNSNYFNHKGEYVNILFADGHVRGVSDIGGVFTLTGMIPSEADRVFLEADRL